MATDQWASFLAAAQARLHDPHLRFAAADARRLPLPSGRWDGVISGLVLNFIPPPEVGLREMVRVTRPGGLIAAYVWNYADPMDFLRVFWDAAAALDPAARNHDEGLCFAALGPSGLGRLFAGVGLIGVEVGPVDAETTFRSFEDFWVPFLGGQGPAPAYVAGLNPEGRAALRERLRRTLPARPDGSISPLARAWAVRGRRPAMS